jgi:hypothetical protein
MAGKPNLGCVSDALTYAIELVVGIGCLALAVQSWRRRISSLGIAAALFALAGLAAIVHAIVELAAEP